MQIGMIGLGRMGANMVRRLLRRGHETAVYDRSAPAVEALAREGALGASSPSDLALAASAYAAILRAEAGDPPVLDLIHLGLGEDGHTASLIPDDPVLEVASCDVAATAPYRGYRRLTLTFPAINRTRNILWVVTGAGKGPALARLQRGDTGIPAGRVRRDRALILTDLTASQAAPRS